MAMVICSSRLQDDCVSMYEKMGIVVDTTIHTTSAAVLMTRLIDRDWMISLVLGINRAWIHDKSGCESPVTPITAFSKDLGKSVLESTFGDLESQRFNLEIDSIAAIISFD